MFTNQLATIKHYFTCFGWSFAFAFIRFSGPVTVTSHQASSSPWPIFGQEL